MALSKDLLEFVGFLNTNKVQYLVVGGYAVAFHGHPRYTKDIDIWIHPELENIHNLLAALQDFGFGSLDLSVQDFQNPDIVIQLGNIPNRIDLLTDIDGVSFSECYPKKQIIDIDGVSINFIDLENLRKNKQASGRLQDLADLENLQ